MSQTYTYGEPKKSMSDRWGVDLKCPKCGYNLNEDRDLFLPVGESIELTCPKCGERIEFTLGIKVYSKIKK